MRHVFDNDLFSPLQHGFLWNRPCMTKLKIVLNDLIKILEDEGHVKSIYLDIQKVFDLVQLKLSP